MAFPLEDVVDVGASTLPPSVYWFVGATAATTATGYWVGDDGCQVGTSFSVSIPAPGSTAVTLAPPADAIGGHVRFGADVRVVKSEAAPTDVVANHARYPVIPGGADWTLGRAI